MLTPQGASSPGSGSSWKSPLVRTPPAPAATAPIPCGSALPLQAASGKFPPLPDTTPGQSRPGVREDAEAAPDTGSAVSGARPVPGPGWGVLPWEGWEGRAEPGQDAAPPEPPLFPWGSRPSLPPRSIFRPRQQPISVRGAREGHRDARDGCKAWAGPQRTQGSNPGAMILLTPAGQQRIPLGRALTGTGGEAAVTNRISLSRNNSGPFQQPPAPAGPPR